MQSFLHASVSCFDKEKVNVMNNESETERFTMSVFRVVNHGKRFDNCSCANKWEWVSVTGSQIGLVRLVLKFKWIMCTLIELHCTTTSKRECTILS